MSEQAVPRLRPGTREYSSGHKRPSRVVPEVVVMAREMLELIPLSKWIRRVKQANVPHIQAFFSPPFSVNALLSLSERQNSERTDEQQRVIDALTWARAEIIRREGYKTNPQRYMFRYDSCSTVDVKSHMARPHSADNLYDISKFHAITVDDPRVMECTLGETTRTVVRPYITPAVIEGYPVEFRVYGDITGVTGISSYYPQRPLNLIDDIVAGKMMMDYVLEVKDMTTQLYKHRAYPFGMTADFLVTPNGETLFLEGGPPHIKGNMFSADPCCFPPGECYGIALEKMTD